MAIITVFFSEGIRPKGDWRYDSEYVIPTEMTTADTTPNYRYHLARYVFALDYVVDKVVLDAACGTGYGTSLMSTLAKEVIGVDKSYKAISYVPSLRFFCKTAFYCGLVEAISSLGGFDTIVSFETIEHLADPLIFFGEIQSCLMVGGHLVCSIPIMCHSPWHKVDYTLAEATDLLSSHFPGIEFYSQKQANILPYQEDTDYLVAVWQKPGQDQFALAFLQGSEAC